MITIIHRDTLQNYIKNQHPAARTKQYFPDPTGETERQVYYEARGYVPVKQMNRYRLWINTLAFRYRYYGFKYFLKSLVGIIPDVY